MWKDVCFYGTGEELIAKAYKDSELSGRCYEAIVRAVETIEAVKAEAKGDAKCKSKKLHKTTNNF